MEGNTYAWTRQDSLNRCLTGEYRPHSLSQLIQEVMELEFKEAPVKFSVLFSGHPETSATLSSYMPSWH